MGPSEPQAVFTCGVIQTGNSRLKKNYKKIKKKKLIETSGIFSPTRCDEDALSLPYNDMGCSQTTESLRNDWKTNE